MNAYFEYLRQMIVAFFEDLGNFFKDLFAGPWKSVPNNFDDYNTYFSHYSPDFGFWGWFFYVLFWILLVGLIGGLGFLLFILIRKYVRFYKTELDKQELKDQIEKLNYELFEAIQEKDKILNLKVGALGIDNPDLTDKDREAVEEVASRFPKLKYVDHEYRDVDTSIPPVDGLSLEEL